MNNTERELWVRNDEGLYFLYLDSNLSITRFLKEYRSTIDEVIRSALHYGDEDAY